MFKSNINMEKIETDKLLMDTFVKCVNDGILLGLKSSLKILNQFLDKKLELNLPEYVNRVELNAFMDEHIKEMENKFS